MTSQLLESPLTNRLIVVVELVGILDECLHVVNETVLEVGLQLDQMVGDLEGEGGELLPRVAQCIHPLGLVTRYVQVVLVQHGVRFLE